MNFIQTIKGWFCCAWLPLYLGGDSNSTQQQTQITETQDNRLVAAPDSNSLSNSRGTIGGNVTINKTSLDNGAIGKSFDFANNSLKEAFSFAGKDNAQAFDFGNTAARLSNSAVSDSFRFAEQITSGAARSVAASEGNAQSIQMSALGAVKSAYADNSAKIADAFTTAKAGEQKILVAAGLLIVGVVAFKALGKNH
jgi:hypothetical protein